MCNIGERNAVFRQKKMRILVVDDEKEIADLIELFLSSEGYEIIKCFDGKSALEKIENEQIDLAILDIMLPDIGGFELCRAIRKEHNYPVIMLTARTDDIDKISGLTIGADDYMTKPFNPLELVARVKAQIRRCSQYNEATKHDDSNFIEIDGLEVDNATHKCFLYGQEVVLTPTEFSILWLLCQNAGKVVSSEEIFQNVWGEKYLDSNNTVMVHIRRLRDKLNEPARNPKFVKTVWGVGYKIEKKS